MRLIQTSPKGSKLYYCNDWQEYIVKPYDALKRAEAWYHTDDKQDAIGTMNAMERD